MQNPGLKPTWRGLRSSTTTPVREFVGRLAGPGNPAEGWLVPGRFGTLVRMKFDQVQVLLTDQPWPYSEVVVEVKTSESSDSAYGRFGLSFADALGVSIDDLDIEGATGRSFHMLRQDGVQFGIDKEGKPIAGTVWRVVAQVQPGQNVQPLGALHTNKAPTAAMPPMPPAPTATVAPPAAPPAAPTAPTPPAASAPAAAGTPSAEDRALSILNGKSAADFFHAVLADNVIRGNGELVDRIIHGAFLQAQISAGRVTQNPDGTYTVV